MYTVTYAQETNATNARMAIAALDKARMDTEQSAYKARIAHLDAELRASLGLPSASR